MEKVPHGLTQLVATYGNPNKNGQLDRTWYNTNIVRMDLPAGMVFKLAWDTSQTVKAIQIHRKCKDSLFQILQEIWNKLRIDIKTVSPNKTTAFYDEACRKEMARLKLDLFGGTFNFRPIRGRSSLSTHAYGIAIDINPSENQLGDTTPQMPMWVVQIFKKHGWVWGGDFKSRPDPMHFQRVSGY